MDKKKTTLPGMKHKMVQSPEPQYVIYKKTPTTTQNTWPNKHIGEKITLLTKCLRDPKSNIYIFLAVLSSVIFIITIMTFLWS